MKAIMLFRVMNSDMLYNVTCMYYDESQEYLPFYVENYIADEDGVQLNFISDTGMTATDGFDFIGKEKDHHGMMFYDNYLIEEIFMKLILGV